MLDRKPLTITGMSMERVRRGAWSHWLGAAFFDYSARQRRKTMTREVVG